MNIDVIDKIIKSAGIRADIISVSRPNKWIMQSQKLFLSNGKTLLLKTGINDEWTDEAAIMNQVHATSMLREQGIPQPEILAYTCDKSEYGFLYLLSKAHSSTKLHDLYQDSDDKIRQYLYEALAQTYGKIHSRRSPWSGVWNGSPDKRKYPINPASFYSKEELGGGSGYALYKNGIISKELFEAICNAWNSNLGFLEQREASLVHISPFPWSIYLSQNGDSYRVNGLTALGDFMWWDAMSDVAHLLYPPFMDISEAERAAFLSCYPCPIDRKAISLYRILNRVCAVSGVYLAIKSEKQQNWANNEILRLWELVDDVRSYS